MLLRLGLPATGILRQRIKYYLCYFRKSYGIHPQISINVPELEMVECLKFLGMNITNNLAWISPIEAMGEKSTLMNLVGDRFNQKRIG